MNPTRCPLHCITPPHILKKLMESNDVSPL